MSDVTSPPAAAPSLHTVAALASAVRIGVMRLARRIRTEREGDDLTLTQLSVLGTLDRCGPQTAGDLAAIERVKPPSMTRTLAALEQAGHITREPHESDGRQIVVELTATARDVLANDRRARDAWLAQRLHELAPDERELIRQVVPILDRLVES